MGTNSRTNRKAEKAYEGHAQKLGQTLILSESMFDRMDERGDDVTSMSVRFPTEESDDFLVTVRMITDTDKVVGFHGGASFHEALRGTLNRLANGTMKWRHDDYA